MAWTNREDGNAWRREYRKRPEVKAREAKYRRKRQDSHVELTQQIKMERGCADCGYDSNGYALHFDHLPGHDKLNEISDMSGRRMEMILKEIEKCEVVCANCHAIRTHERKQYRQTENEQ